MPEFTPPPDMPAELVAMQEKRNNLTVDTGVRAQLSQTHGAVEDLQLGVGIQRLEVPRTNSVDAMQPNLDVSDEQDHVRHDVFTTLSSTDAR